MPHNSPGAKAARRAFVLQGRFRRFFSNLGPGLITGAADDDPSGIATYSVTGAAFGYAPLWTAIFSFPLMAAIQTMCARLGMVTGLGLAGVIRVRYPRWILWSACSLLVIANTVNIAPFHQREAEDRMPWRGRLPGPPVQSLSCASTWVLNDPISNMAPAG